LKSFLEGKLAIRTEGKRASRKEKREPRKEKEESREDGRLCVAVLHSLPSFWLAIGARPRRIATFILSIVARTSSN
jgi:hypothetical protein